MTNGPQFALLYDFELRALAKHKISGSGVIIYALLAMHCRQGSSCFPSVKRMMECLGYAYNERTFWKAMKRLREAGLVHQDPSRRSKTRFFLPYRVRPE